MKRMLELVLALTMLLTLAGCGDVTAAESASQSQPAESAVTASTPAPKPSDNLSGEFPEFNKTAQIEETILLDEDNVRVLASDLTYGRNAAELTVTIENNSNKDLSFISGSMGYSCNSVNGIMVEDGYLNCDVAAGKKAMDTIILRYDTLQLYGIHEIADIELGIYTSDDDYNDVYYTPRKVTTSAASDYVYDPLGFQQVISSKAAQNKFGYEVKFFAAERLYEQGGIAVLSEALLQNKDGDYLLFMETENQSEDLRIISTSNITVNNLILQQSRWDNHMIAPGKRGIIAVNLSNVLEDQYWELYGIEDISSISVDLQQSSNEWDVLTDCEKVIISIDDKNKIDTTGEEIYNQNGVRIVKKALFGPESRYDIDYGVMLLAENTGDGELNLNIVYDTLSVNGFMVDYSCDDRKLQPGECAMIKVRIYDDDLEEIKVTSLDQIKQVEFELEIEQNGSVVDTPTITLNRE